MFGAVVVPQLAPKIETLTAGITKVRPDFMPIIEVDFLAGAALEDLWRFPLMNASLTADQGDIIHIFIHWGIYWSSLGFTQV